MVKPVSSYVHLPGSFFAVNASKQAVLKLVHEAEHVSGPDAFITLPVIDPPGAASIRASAITAIYELDATPLSEPA